MEVEVGGGVDPTRGAGRGGGRICGSVKGLKRGLVRVQVGFIINNLD